MHIKAIVLNSVLRDARVLKQADSLVQAGHEVTIIGVQDTDTTEKTHLLPSGVRIELTPPVDRRQVRRRLLYTLVAAVLAVCVVLLTLAGATVDPVLLGVPFAWLPATTLTILVLAAATLLTAWQLQRRARKARQSMSIVLALKQLFMALFSPVLNRLYAEAVYSRVAPIVVRSPTDVIHCHDLLPLPIAAKLKRKTHAMLVWDAHEIYEEMAQKRPDYAKFCRRLLTQYQHTVDRFITINDSIAEFYRENYPALPPALIVKNAALHTPHMAYDGRLHHAAGLPRNQKIALYQGGFADKRGLHALVDAAAYLDPDWTLVMMGWGPLETALKARSKGLHTMAPRSLPAVVFLPGVKQNELVCWTGGGAVGLIPYENTGLNHLYCTPNKLWEYPAAGVPVLCSPLVEMTRMVRGHGIGWLLPESADPPAIAAVINKLKPDMLGTAVEACRRFIETDNWGTYGARVVEMYDSLSNPHPVVPASRLSETDTP